MFIIPGNNPRNGESAKKDLGGSPVSGVLQQLGGLEEDVGAIVEQENEGADLRSISTNNFQ